ncbi:spermidine/putrescine transport system substrate-binding protein [Nitrosomonas cryotolerans]|uniref:Putrescine-binding periplasmic protein n=1 Tax=Nitrosomonas cryotolerans ATCC 49181 TaxID=1131553 RepID=A0A1N6IK75_9PROT|nr:spermidine/putrescine ABC transporter substrate-binding protein [Nitrosomonas cryotolerans]SFP93486.1 spermidine/putrescine transport system substrate-binding protein [Nitrosomonas cryotolerans]SIO32412.1 spermidine/putrescine transport system substrate-binding protein [Nitrosomonas cryotolerans ATCC 49181]
MQSYWFNLYIRMILLISLILSVTGCNNQQAFSSSASESKNTLYLFNWNNYIAPETIKRFEEYCQCHISQDYYSDNEEMLAKMAAGATGYDLIVPTGNAMDTLIRQNVLKPLDKTLLPNFKNIDPLYLNTAFDPANQYSVPYAYTLTLLGFNHTKMQELGLPTDTWAIIFEPEYLKKIKGRVTVLDSQRELMAAALKYLGYSANDTNAQHWNQAKNLIVRAKPYWAAFNNTSYIRELAVGNLWVAHGYSNDMFQAENDARNTKRDFQISFSIPKEGAVLSLDSMVLHQSGLHTNLALQFINFMLEGKNSAELTNLIGSGNPNMEAMQYIQPKLTHNKALFPDQASLTQLEMLEDLDHKQRRLLSRLWTEIKLR